MDEFTNNNFEDNNKHQKRSPLAIIAIIIFMIVLIIESIDVIPVLMKGQITVNEIIRDSQMMKDLYYGEITLLDRIIGVIEIISIFGSIILSIFVIAVTKRENKPNDPLALLALICTPVVIFLSIMIQSVYIPIYELGMRRANCRDSAYNCIKNADGSAKCVSYGNELLCPQLDPTQDQYLQE